MISAMLKNESSRKGILEDCDAKNWKNDGRKTESCADGDLMRL